jgi:hypothetical protein
MVAECIDLMLRGYIGVVKSMATGLCSLKEHIAKLEIELRGCPLIANLLGSIVKDNIEAIIMEHLTNPHISKVACFIPVALTLVTFAFIFAESLVQTIIILQSIATK